MNLYAFGYQELYFTRVIIHITRDRYGQDLLIPNFQHDFIYKQLSE